MHTLLPAPGEIVWIRHRRWRVARASRHRGVVRLDVTARHEQLTFLAPFDRPSPVSHSERPRRARPRGALARFAHLLARAHGVRTLLSAVNANVTLLAYQLEPALAILHGARRVLIADDVGLGKTIQAGVVIAELLRRAAGARVLVLVPASLAEQWRDELAMRFGVHARLADRGALEAVARSGARGDNPWRRAGVWIASLDYVKQPHVLTGLPSQPWDLVVFDEAHVACGESERHAAADGLARRSRRVLLLTATPHDGDERRFSRLAGLGDLQDDLTVFRRTRADVSTPRGRRVRWHTVALSPEEQRVLDVLAGYERAVLTAAGAVRRDAALLLLGIFRKRALSTMSALAISLERRQDWLERSRDSAVPDWMQPSLHFGNDEASDDASAADASSLVADVGLDPRQERAWLKRLRTLAGSARRREAKIARLVALLNRSAEPAVVFTEFRHSLEAVRSRIDLRKPVAVLHGGQDPAERSRQLNMFLGESSAVLLATDVASLGLNLQHRARWVVSLELPWNPARLEQRLGRVDRIGQTKPVHFTLLVARHEAESAVLKRLARRALTARQALGDDLLQGVHPTALQLTNCVVTGAPIEPSSPNGGMVPICRRWTRIARASARALEWRRRLGSRWRAPSPGYGRPRVAQLARWPSTLVFTVLIVDGAGAPIEEHVVAVRIADGIALDAHGAAIAAAREIAARRITPHVARVHRWLCRQRQITAWREHALVVAMNDEHRPGEAQPGLFDRRVLRAFEQARDHAVDARVEEQASIAEHDRIAVAVAGRPRLALILNPSSRPLGRS